MKFQPLNRDKVKVGDTVRDPEGVMWYVVKIHSSGAVEATPVSFIQPDARWLKVQDDQRG